jgi:diguanylate cyclase (GGDEF)-like protein
MGAHEDHERMVKFTQIAMKILLVDDARSVVQVMTSRLSSYGYEVVYAENGKVAVERFSETSPDLVLMDIEMPVMNGFESASRIRALEAQKQWAWTPIIFLTSSDTVQNLVTAIEAGGDDFMSKFVPEPVLHAKMKAMGRIATLRQRLSVANEKLQNLADHDGLTGLVNRRSMDTKIDLLWFESIPAKTAFSLLMLDIDNFKKYNDHYGHQSGDVCLRRVAHSIEATILESNATGVTKDAFAARYGGEEFAVIVPAASQQAVKTLATSIVERVRLLSIPHELNAEWGIVTISVGGAYLEVAEGELANLFRLADSRLYRAKSDGRNCAVMED